MATLALVLAAVLTALFIPMVHSIQNSSGPDSAGAGIGIFMLSVIRGGVLIAALLLASRGVHAALVVAGVVLMELVCCAMHFLSIDNQISLPTLFAVLATLLPVLLIASGFGYTRLLFFTGLGLSAAAGLGSFLAYDTLTAPFKAQRAKEFQAAADLLDRRTAALNAIPENAPLSALVDFTGYDEPSEVQGRALARINKQPGAVAVLADLLRTPQRLLALYALHEMDELPESVHERSWQAAGEIAAEFSKRLETGPKLTHGESKMLFLAVQKLGNKPNVRHLPELTAVREVIYKANKLGQSYDDAPWLDMQITQVKKLTE